MKAGAYQFIERPLDAEKIMVMIKSALEKYTLRKENLALQESLAERYAIIGSSPYIKAIKNKICLLKILSRILFYLGTISFWEKNI